MHSKGMMSYLVMMAVRLIADAPYIKRHRFDLPALRPHCIHYLKALMDCVFGAISKE